MHPNTQKITKLLRQYPFLQTIVDQVVGGGHSLTDITIKVERADGELMWRMPMHANTERPWGVLTDRGKGKKARKLTANPREYCALVDTGSQVLHIEGPEWPQSSRSHVPRAGDVLLGQTGDGFLRQRTAEPGYIVWIDVYDWHEYGSNDEQPLGEYVDTQLVVTLYRSPRGIGLLDLWDKTRDPTNYARLMSAVSMLSYTEALVVAYSEQHRRAFGRVDELCQRLYDELYVNGGLKAAYDAQENRFVRFSVGALKVSFGQSMIYYDPAIEIEGPQLFLSATEAGSCKGEFRPVTIDGTIPALRAAVNQLIKAWSEPKSRPELIAIK